MLVLIMVIMDKSVWEMSLNIGGGRVDVVSDDFTV